MIKIILISLIVTFSISAAAAAEPLRVYLSPTGDDAREGLVADQAIKSLGRAEEVVKKQLAVAHNDVEVRFAPGTYVGQIVKWKFSMPDHSITFMPADEKSPPVFDGGGAKGTWFTFSSHNDGAATNLVFRYLCVQNYMTAISFTGDRKQVTSSSRANIIDGCHFLHVGEDGNAAVRLQNSSRNQVVNCHFESILRKSSRGLLHAIYVAHMSCDNQILRNHFETCCGDTVRFRDGANGNTVAENRFTRSGELAAVTDWYCDHDKESDCTKPTPESPSWNNVVKDNILDKNFAGWPLEATAVYSSHLPSGAALPPANGKRFIASGNHKP